MMEKEFVPYELAVKLKELGFGSKRLDFYLGCFAYYGNEVSNLKGKLIPNNTMMKHSNFNYSEFIMAPLWQQAFDWFRKEHNLHALNSPLLNQEWSVVIDNTLNAHQVHWDKKPNYEEARLECLKKLIEIIENKVIIL